MDAENCEEEDSEFRPHLQGNPTAAMSIDPGPSTSAANQTQGSGENLNGIPGHGPLRTRKRSHRPAGCEDQSEPIKHAFEKRPDERPAGFVSSHVVIPEDSTVREDLARGFGASLRVVWPTNDQQDAENAAAGVADVDMELEASTASASATRTPNESIQQAKASLRACDDSSSEAEQCWKWLFQLERSWKSNKKLGAKFLSGLLNVHSVDETFVSFPSFDVFGDATYIYYVGPDRRDRYENRQGFVYRALGNGQLQRVPEYPTRFVPDHHFSEKESRSAIPKPVERDVSKYTNQLRELFDAAYPE